MNIKLILHIPHSSTNIPLMDGFTVSQQVLENEILKLTDWHTDDLFYSKDDCTIKANFSRIFCDPERFSDDSQEEMAKSGMGVLYEKSDDGLIIREVNQALREKILETYYWTHHKKFSEAVNEQLKTNDKAVIIDCHSFPRIPLKRAINQQPLRPDFNIGTDSFHTPKYLIEISEEFFKSKGYSLGIDYPYSGSIVPMEHYHKTKNVESIMLEINRGLYLKEPSNEKSSDYFAIKEVVKEYLDTIKTACDNEYK
jgi:N-formylglutamate deformylase